MGDLAIKNLVLALNTASSSQHMRVRKLPEAKEITTPEG